MTYTFVVLYLYYVIDIKMNGLICYIHDAVLLVMLTETEWRHWTAESFFTATTAVCTILAVHRLVIYAAIIVTLTIIIICKVKRNKIWMYYFTLSNNTEKKCLMVNAYQIVFKYMNRAFRLWVQMNVIRNQKCGCFSSNCWKALLPSPTR